MINNKQLLNKEEVTSGEIIIGPSIKIGYYAQEHENLNYEQDLISEIRQTTAISREDAINIDKDDQQRLKQYIHLSDKTIFEPIFTSRGVLYLHIKTFTPSTDALYEEQIENRRERIINSIKSMKFEEKKEELVESANVQYLL